MAITPLTINIDVDLPNGQEFATAVMTFTLSGYDADTATDTVLVPAVVSATLSNQGVGTVDLWPIDDGLAGRFYDVKLYATFVDDTQPIMYDLGRIQPQGSSTLELSDLLDVTGSIVGGSVFTRLSQQEYDTLMTLLANFPANQDLNTDSSPEFAGLTIGGVSIVRPAAASDMGDFRAESAYYTRTTSGTPEEHLNTEDVDSISLVEFRQDQGRNVLAVELDHAAYRYISPRNPYNVEDRTARMRAVIRWRGVNGTGLPSSSPMYGTFRRLNRDGTYSTQTSAYDLNIGAQNVWYTMAIEYDVPLTWELVQFTLIKRNSNLWNGDFEFDILQFEEVTSETAEFNTVAAMQASPLLAVGQIVRTHGYGSPKDGGGNTYEIVETGTGTADGGSYIDLSGSGHQAKGLFPEGINYVQFGALGNEVANDSPAMQACVTYCGIVADELDWYVDDRPNPGAGHFGPPVTIKNVPGKVFAMESGVTVTEANRGLVFEPNAYKAIGGWSNTDFMFSAAGGNGTKITMERPMLNCNYLCSGIETRAFWVVRDPIIRAMAAGTGAQVPENVKADAGVGIKVAGPKTNIFNPDIKEWTNEHTEFFTQSNYGAIGIVLDANDARIWGGEVGWCLENIRVKSGANHKIIGTHLFNGMENFASNSGVGRSYHPLLVNEPQTGAVPNLELQDVYLDNGSLHLFNPYVTLDNCEVNGNSNHTADLGDDDYWVTMHAFTTSGSTFLRIKNTKAGVVTFSKRLVQYVTYLSNTWGFPNATMEASSQNNVTVKDAYYSHNDKEIKVGQESEAATYRTMADECKLLFRGEQNAFPAAIGVDGTTAIFEAPNGDFALRNVQTDEVLFSITGGLVGGTAVQTDFGSQTAGKLLQMGSLGLGAATDDIAITDLTVTLVPGMYKYAASTATGAPETAAYNHSMVVMGTGAGGSQTQTAFVSRTTGNADNLMAWVGARTGTSGAWVWRRISGLSDLSGTDPDGIYHVSSEGLLTCQKDDFTVDYTDTAKCSTVWTFPRAFSANPSVGITIVDTSGATPSITDMVAVRVSSLSTTQATINIIRGTGFTNFASGDEVGVSLTAIGPD